jgi:hypothetical protein
MKNLLKITIIVGCTITVLPMILLVLEAVMSNLDGKPSVLEKVLTN